MDCPASHRVSVLRATQDTPSSASLYGTFTLFGWPSQTLPLLLWTLESFNPEGRNPRFGLLRFRSPLLAESSLFLGLLRCFTSPGSLPSQDAAGLTTAGFPIRIPPTTCGCTRLVGAFRSVPRPSSALDTQASPVCPYSLPSHDTENPILSRSVWFSLRTSVV